MDLAVVVFSPDGLTFKMAEAIAETGRGAVFDAGSLTAVEWEKLDRAGAVVMGAPTYMGGLPGAFVSGFIEVAAERWDRGLWRDKLAGGFTSAMHPAGDKLNALTSLSIFAAQMGMIWVGAAETGAPVVPGNLGINRDGAWLGVTATRGDAGAVLRSGDLETAQRYGVRMRACLDRWQAMPE